MKNHKNRIQLYNEGLIIKQVMHKFQLSAQSKVNKAKIRITIFFSTVTLDAISNSCLEYYRVVIRVLVLFIFVWFLV